MAVAGSCVGQKVVLAFADALAANPDQHQADTQPGKCRRFRCSQREYGGGVGVSDRSTPVNNRREGGRVGGQLFCKKSLVRRSARVPQIRDHTECDELDRRRDTVAGKLEGRPSSCDTRMARRESNSGAADAVSRHRGCERCQGEIQNPAG